MPVKAVPRSAHHPAASTPSGGHLASALHIVCPHCDTINRVPRERLRKGGKCRSIAPVFERAAAELEPDVRLLKVDSDAKSGLMALLQLLAWTRDHVDGVKV